MWGIHGGRGALSYNGVWGLSTQCSPGAESLVKAHLKLNAQKEQHFWPFLEVLETKVNDYNMGYHVKV